MDAYLTWKRLCDWVTAMVTEGMMTDDFPEYDWYACWQWGDTPIRAVSGAVMRRRCDYCGRWLGDPLLLEAQRRGICTC